jgi:hypothetical protein
VKDGWVVREERSASGAEGCCRKRVLVARK